MLIHIQVSKVSLLTWMSSFGVDMLIHFFRFACPICAATTCFCEKSVKAEGGLGYVSFCLVLANSLYLSALARSKLWVRPLIMLHRAPFSTSTDSYRHLIFSACMHQITTSSLDRDDQLSSIYWILLVHSGCKHEVALDEAGSQQLLSAYRSVFCEI